MLSVPGVYKNGTITLLEPIPNLQSASVIVTVLEQNPLAYGMATKMAVESWLGNMQGTAWILGDIVEPIEDSLSEWLVLQE